MKPNVRRLAILFALASLAIGVPRAVAQPSSATPITLVVPAAAGAPTDTVARGLAASLRAYLGQPVVVENVAGADGTLGMAQVLRARPDGRVIGLHHLGMAIAPSLYRKPPFDPVADFEPVGLVNEVPMLLLARPDFPAGTFDEAVAHLRANGEQVHYAHAGLGSASHLCGLVLQSALGVSLATVPYKANATAMGDLLAGRVDMMCDQAVSAGGQVAADKLKAYGIASDARLAKFPALAPLAAQGLAGFDVSNWHGLYAPKGTPQPVIDRLSAALRFALGDRNYAAKMAELGVVNHAPDQGTPEALRARLQQEIERWTPLIRSAGDYVD